MEDIISTLKMETYIDRKVETYSLGMKQRLCFAMVVATNTSVMLLDEVMNGLDPQNVQLISHVLLNLRAQGKLIIMASHLLQNLQQYADQVLFLKNGKIIENLNNKAETKKYLEFHDSSLINDILEESNYQILPNQTILLSIDELSQDKFDSIIHILLENNISFTVEKISLEDLFNKFYE
ncbi:ATP-binding cassette domain-containing protein [Lactobacillus taiwanensis]|uniref:ATP-binding cassette domain-containing protein n=1 Tax=Lactobacillus taiwanensis TaxID=508451 RepID=UPI0021C29C92|nr:ATP-binding cassette domain-containing protein [Lactobacillus taiwanensis]